jgi:protein ImuA
MAPVLKSEVLARLQDSILKLQGFKDQKGLMLGDALEPICSAFPNNTFPIGAVHEFICSGSEAAAATTGFIGGILTSLTRQGGVIAWISSSSNVFPVAMKGFLPEPDKIVFIKLKTEKEVMWAMNEALRCESLAAVIGELNDIDFKSTRRLQLAVERSMVTGFILKMDSRRNLTNESKQNPTACVTRWAITPLPGEHADDLPGLGYPRWNVELMKVRNGRPGIWQLTWKHGRFQLADPSSFDREDQQKIAG